MSDPIGDTSGSTLLSDSSDFTGVVELGGLAPATDYWFRARLDGVEQAGSDGAFTTFPPTGQPGTFSFAFGSCTDHRQAPFPIFSTLEAEKLSFFMHIGDIIYADAAPAAMMQSEFEDRYKLNFSDANWVSLMKQLPGFMIWDDHELENDWAGGQTGLYLEARPAFEEYVSSHNPDPRVDGELYYVFSVGQADFFVLDTRSYRDNGIPTMLGSQQLDELESWLLASTAVFKFIVSSVQWTSVSGRPDTWFGYEMERAAIFDFIRENEVGGVILLSGDRHWIGVFRHEYAAPYFLYEFSSSPWAATIGTVPTADDETLFLDDSSRSFIRFDIDTTPADAVLTARVINQGGKELYSLVLDEIETSGQRLFLHGFEN